MSDTLNLVVIDDVGPEQGQITANQMTDDPSPTVRVWLTTASGASIAAGDTLKVSDMGFAVAQAVVTAEDASRGYVDIAAHYVTGGHQDFGVSAYDPSNNPLAGGDLPIVAAPSDLTRTPLIGGGHVTSYDTSSSTFHQTHLQLYDGAGQAVGGVSDYTGSGYLGDYSVVPLAGGAFLALFRESDHFAETAMRLGDAAGHVTSLPIVSGFNQAVGGLAGGFVAYGGDGFGLGGVTYFETFEASGAAMSDRLRLAGQITGVTAVANGDLDIAWNDDGTSRTLEVDPRLHSNLANPTTAPSVTVIDDKGAQTGAVAAGATTDDDTPTVRVGVYEVGEAHLVFGKSGAEHLQSPIAVTQADVTRGYVEVTLKADQGEGSYSVFAKDSNSDGLVSPTTSQSFTLQTSPPPPPPPPPPSGGQTLQGQPGGSALVGGSGDDTLVGGSGPDQMTGGGGADHFAWNSLPWSAAEVTDFTDGVDKLDLTGLLFTYHYSGYDPVADGWVKPIDDGHGDTWLYLDTDGRGSADPWGTFIATLDHVPASAITGADLVGGPASPPPPPPPGSPPPPPSQGMVLQGQNGGSNLVGGSGDDTLDGGYGPDTMTGGGGADQFVWNPLPWSAATVTDFSEGADHINLSGLLAAYHYSGSDPIADGYVKLIDDSHGDTWVYFDTDGHGSGDPWGTFIATLKGVSASSLGASDFIFH